MLQAAQFAEAIGTPQSEILVGVQWMGLAGRELTHMEGRRHISPGRIARQDRLDLEATLRADQIAERLPEILFDFLTPLYALFDLFVLPKSLVDQEVQKLRAGRFYRGADSRSDLVPEVGLEPTHLAVLDFESSASTNSTTRATRIRLPTRGASDKPSVGEVAGKGKKSGSD